MPIERYPIVYSERPVPFEVVGLSAAGIIGFITLFSETTPTSIAKALPPSFQVGWAVTLCLGSLVALYGVSFGRSRGVFFEQVGIFAAGAGCLVYAAALIATRPEAAAAMAFGMTAAYGIACMWRFAQLLRLVRHAEELNASNKKRE